MCEFCGTVALQSSVPYPGSSCTKNPNGKFHSWVMDSEDGKSHRWSCAYCGTVATQRGRPYPGTTCNRNPNGKFHKWIQND